MLSQEYICQSGEIGVPPASKILLSLRILVRELFSVGHVSTRRQKRELCQEEFYAKSLVFSNFT